MRVCGFNFGFVRKYLNRRSNIANGNVRDPCLAAMQNLVLLSVKGEVLQMLVQSKIRARELYEWEYQTD